MASGRWSNNGGGLRAIFCDGFRASFGAVPFSRLDALSIAGLASSGDMLEARESPLWPFGVAEALRSSLFNLIPLGLGRSSIPSPTTVPEARRLPSMATKRGAQI